MKNDSGANAGEKQAGDSASLPHYGGQAVIEGVMMRGARHWAIAVREPEGGIRVKSEPLTGLYVGRLRSLPFVRGPIVLWETLTLGMRALVFSTEVAAGLEEEEPSKAYIWGVIGVALALATAIFFVGPVLLTGWLESQLGNETLVVFIEGVLRLLLLLAYIWSIGFIPDIKRVFAYHGAEHRTINAWEAGEPLEVESVQRFGNAHTRCGTGFLLTVAVVSLVVFVFLGMPTWWWRITSRVVLIPVIAAISYEIIRFAAAFWRFRVVRWLFRPSIALQSLTTRDPDDGQVEVAITALRAVLVGDGVEEATVRGTPPETPARGGPPS
jgi:uncharacterized protein YqhQ